MKKTLLTILCALTSIVGMAQNQKTYTESYVVSLNGTPTAPREGEETITDNVDGTINFLLKDFVAGIEDVEIPLGDISLENIAVTEGEDGLTYFSDERTITIPSENLPADYQILAQFGYFTDIPLKLDGKYNDQKLFATMSLDMSKLNLMVTAQFGTEDISSGTADQKVYTEPLIVTLNGNPTASQIIDVIITNNGDGTINFALNNFVLAEEESEVGVGNLVIENIPTEQGEDGLTYFSYNGPLVVQPGDREDIDTWVGPMLGEIPLDLHGKMNDEKLYVAINIEMMGQVYVQFGTDDFFPELNEKVYTEQLIVTLNGNPTASQIIDVIITDNGDGTINFALNNFVLAEEESEVGVGNLVIENIPTEQGEDGLTYFNYNGPLVVQPGDREDIDTWVGPMLGEIPLDLHGKMNDEKLYVAINIEMMGQVYVQFGTDDFFSKKGDLNGDDKVDIADAVSVLNIMAAGSNDPAADMNDDGKVDVADFVSILNIMAGQ